MESQLDWHHAKALLEWQIELGATEAILDAPVNRFELTDNAAAKAPAMGGMELLRALRAKTGLNQVPELKGAPRRK